MVNKPQFDIRDDEERWKILAMVSAEAFRLLVAVLPIAMPVTVLPLTDTVESAMSTCGAITAPVRS